MLFDRALAEVTDMLRFHFDLWDGTTLLLDNEGVQLPDHPAMKSRALLAARDLLSEEVRNGRIPLCMRLDVRDETGRTIHQLRFADAVEIVA